MGENESRFSRAFQLLNDFTAKAERPQRLGDESTIHQKLWEIECKLEELVNAFVDSNINEKEAREYAKVFGDLEAAYSKVINFIAVKKGISHSLPSFLNKDDVKKVLEVVK